MKQTINTLKVLGEENRLRIFLALDQNELCVCQIVALLRLAPSTTSKHLALLYQAGIIDQRREGKWAFYKVSPEWRKNNCLHEWLIENFQKSAACKAEKTRLQEILATPLDQLCNSQAAGQEGTMGEECCPPVESTGKKALRR